MRLEGCNNAFELWLREFLGCFGQAEPFAAAFVSFRPFAVHVIDLNGVDQGNDGRIANLLRLGVRKYAKADIQSLAT